MGNGDNETRSPSAKERLTGFLASVGIGQPKIGPKTTPSAGSAISDAKRKSAANEAAEDYDANSGNPCHYQTHVKDRQGKNRQGRKGGSTCHHGK